MLKDTGDKKIEKAPNFYRAFLRVIKFKVAPPLNNWVDGSVDPASYWDPFCNRIDFGTWAADGFVDKPEVEAFARVAVGEAAV